MEILGADVKNTSAGFILKEEWTVSKVIRRKHLKIIELLSEAMLEVLRLVRQERYQDCLMLLGDCQESAITLGSHIEKLYGLQTKTVKVLEEYCEALYQMSVAVEEQSGLQEVALALGQATEQIKCVYGQEFPEKIEVAFLPYKAAMWDSLESIWMAARDDENCEAYVVPIPYYDLDENRNFKEMHYEGDLYPDYVPITHYEDYNLEERHPDMIFIHNPYDQFNTVTSVEPAYYSSKIKAYTDKLVYIPYFVLGEIDPRNQLLVDNIKHFCYLPGIAYADIVIVESEDMRQIYIDEYLKMAQQQGNFITRERLEKRILGYGSPKLDKVQNTQKEELEIPEDWLKVIKKTDGTWKKIIFYNISLTAFLKDSEQMLVKINNVLRTFKENKDEVALLWRPHPLMLSTLESMRPDLRDSYKKIVSQYCEEGWGIYDESANLNRAVVICDGYYGDWSSVINLCQRAGKPVLIQNV